MSRQRLPPADRSAHTLPNASSGRFKGTDRLQRLVVVQHAWRQGKVVAWIEENVEVLALSCKMSPWCACKCA